MGNRKNISVEVGSLFILGLGVFASMALVSYHAADPSMFSSGSEVPLNECGRVGSYLAAALLNIFGLGAFLFPAGIFFVASAMHRNEGAIKIAGILGSMTVAVSSITVFLALQWKSWSFGRGVLLTGGILGEWIAVALQTQLNYFGSSLVSFLVFSVSIVIATPVRLTEFLIRGTRALGVLVLRLMGWLAYQAMLLLGRGLRALWRESRQWAQTRLERVRLQESKIDSQSGPVLLDDGTDQTEPLQTIGKIPLNQVVEISKASESIQSPGVTQVTDVVGENVEVSPSVLLKGEQEIKILPRESVQSSLPGSKLSRATIQAKQGQWKLPVIDFLKKPPVVESAVDRGKLISNSQILKQKFADFGIEGEVTAVRPGPVITLYEFKPGPGVKVSRIAALADDLSMALSAQSVRILAPLPGKSVVGIEIPSDTRETVYLREFLQHPDFYGSKHSIPVVMGKDIGGQTYLSDLARMPHLLCAGQTGSGKSVFMNGLICSLFFRFTPDELRMILVDPKFIEFRAYQDLPHLLLPVVDDPKQASIALRWAVREMERRYRILAKVGARNLASFNQKVDEMGAEVVQDLLFSEESSTESSAPVSGSDWVEAFDPDETGAPRVGKLPYIVVIIDELADLMMIAKKEVEISIARIAQKARAAGIHLIIATQRPSTDVITGLIKANLPSRVSFQLASYVDSKTILDRAGAERLLGQGDMLFVPPGVSQSLRLHGAYLDDDEIGKITSFLKAQGKPAYRAEILLAGEDDEAEENAENEADDELFRQAVDLVKHSGHASASFLQRHLKVGYNRAARMIETMESRGIVGPQEGARPREVLIR
jgi:hypothetical protein